MLKKTEEKIFIENLIYEIIDEHNKLNPKELQLEKSLDTILAGNNGKLDSLGLINFLVEVESNLQLNLEKNISIIDETLLVNAEGPYKNIKTLKVQVRTLRGRSIISQNIYYFISHFNISRG